MAGTNSNMDYELYLTAREHVNKYVRLDEYFMDYVEDIDLSVTGKARCPIHDEADPSFFYFQETDTFHCFGCGKTGGTTELHYHLEKRNKPNYKKTRSVIDLAKLYEVEIPNFWGSGRGSQVSALKPTQKLAFKPRKEIRKPLKKVENDALAFLKRMEKEYGREWYLKQTFKIDEIMFIGVDPVERIERFLYDLID